MNQVAAPSFRDQFAKMENEMKMALPVHIPVERFMRVVLTAVNGNPDLLQADRQSLFEACMKAAQDGLLPDGREGALVIYNTKVPGKGGAQDRWIKKVQWMPMVAGIMKKARNSGEIALITAGYVVGGDKFRYWIDDDGEHIFYEPGEKQDFNVFICAFAMAKTKDGVIYAQRVTPNDVEKMRNASKAKDGPAWKNWYDQMAMKGAIRRLAKRLPTSSDLDDLIRRDDDLYDFKNQTEGAVFAPVRNPLRDEAPVHVIEHNASEGDPRGDDGAPWNDEEAEGHSDGKDAVREQEGARGAAQAMAQADKVVDASGKFVKDRDGDADGKHEAQVQPAEKTEHAASASPATAEETAKASEPAEKPYTDGPSYLAHMKAAIDATKTKAKCTDLWGSTRKERNEMLNDDQIDELTLYKSTHLKKLQG